VRYVSHAPRLNGIAGPMMIPIIALNRASSFCLNFASTSLAPASSRARVRSRDEADVSDGNQPARRKRA